MPVDVRWYVVSLRGSFPLGSGVVGVGVRGPDGEKQVYTPHSVGKIKTTKKKLCVRGNSRCVLIPVWGTLSGTYVWLWRSAE